MKLMFQLVCHRPQGTQLSVLLFIIYINDVSNVPKQSKLILFADDTALKISGKDLTMIINDMNEEKVYFLRRFTTG